MKNRLFQLLLCFSLPFALHAQQAAKKPGCGCRFSSINQVGLLEGSNGSAFQLQTINGVRYKTWFAGLGAGIDYYRFRTVPLFADVRKDLFNKINTPFFYGDIGVHVPWVRDQDKEFWGLSSYNTGLYYDAGVGYSLDIGKKRAIMFSGGISLKKIRETRNYEVVCIMAPCPEQIENYNFSLRRFSLKAGIRL